MIFGNFNDNNIEFVFVESNMSTAKSNSILELGKNRYNVYVYSNEGYIPHFHIERGKEFECCIEFEFPEYFDHNGKINGTLNSKYCSALNIWLNERPNGTINNWQRLVNEWNRNNRDPKKIIQQNIIQPDYSIIYPYGYFTKNNK